MKKNNKMKIIALSLMAVLSIGSFSACSTQDENNSNGASPDISVSDSDSNTNDTEESKEDNKSTENNSQTDNKNSSTQNDDDKENGEIPVLSDPTPDEMGETINGILVYNRVAYELFGGGESLA